MPCLYMGPNGYISSHSNLGWLRRAVSRWVVDTVYLHRKITGEGELSVDFADGGKYLVDFASFAVLCWTLRNWRNLRGVELRIDGQAAGTVDFHNKTLEKESC